MLRWIMRRRPAAATSSAAILVALGTTFGTI
jgi:hypothetical protein